MSRRGWGQKENRENFEPWTSDVPYDGTYVGSYDEHLFSYVTVSTQPATECSTSQSTQNYVRSAVSYRRLSTIPDISPSETAKRNKELVHRSNHSLKLASHKILGVPGLRRFSLSTPYLPNNAISPVTCSLNHLLIPFRDSELLHFILINRPRILGGDGVDCHVAYVVPESLIPSPETRRVVSLEDVGAGGKLKRFT